MIADLVVALREAKEKNGYTPSMIRLPSCMYRLLAREVEPLLGYSNDGTSTFSIGAVSIHNSFDGT